MLILKFLKHKLSHVRSSLWTEDAGVGLEEFSWFRSQTELKYHFSWYCFKNFLFLRLGGYWTVSCWTLFSCNLRNWVFLIRVRWCGGLVLLDKTVFLFPSVPFYYFPGTLSGSQPLCWASSGYWRISVDTAEYLREFWNQRGKRVRPVLGEQECLPWQPELGL